MIPDFSRDEAQIEAESRPITAAIRAAVRDALIEHKRLGQPIVVGDDNQNPIWVPAEEIEIPDLQDERSSSSDAAPKA